LVLAAPALAQLKSGAGQPLTEAEAKAALLGIDMQGYSPTYRMAWRECIEPDGETLYETPAGVVKGRLVISPRGEACFSYEDSGYAAVSCFTTYRTGDVLRFEGFGKDAKLSHTGDVWTLKYTGGAETFKLVGVTELAAGDTQFV
jgi:hypothetical protein